MKLAYTGENDRRTFKEACASVIPDLCEKDERVVYLDADLMSCIGTYKWGKNAEKAINCGIAEANMVGVACGMAAVGMKPIVHSFGCFSSRRCFDQAFLSGGYAKNAITVLGSDPGVCAGFNGGTHMPFEDMALYRAVPEATVIDISDISMFEDVLRQSVDRPGVKYIRFPRKNCVRLYEEGAHFEIGKGIVLREGADAVILASGIMAAKALKAAETLAAEGIDAAVIDMFTVKPLDEELVVEWAKKTGAVVTCENHNRIGGLTSAVSETLAARCPTPLEYVAVEDVFGEVGPQDYLEEAFALTEAHIAEQVRKAIRRK
ncbi:MAG: transketolase family protein [Oscillospiraceae bacterium]|nr:transketolase family protein [Oscillospiraceae bacterium]